MPIEMTCPGCKALFRLPDDLAGTQVRCQKCAQMFSVPMLPEVLAEEPVVAEGPAAAPTVPTTVFDPPAKEDVVQATLVEPPPRKAPPITPSPAGIFATLAAVALFLFALVSIGGFAASWISLHLSPPIYSGKAK